VSALTKSQLAVLRKLKEGKDGMSQLRAVKCELANFERRGLIRFTDDAWWWTKDGKTLMYEGPKPTPKEPATKFMTTTIVVEVPTGIADDELIELLDRRVVRSLEDDETDVQVTFVGVADGVTPAAIKAGADPDPTPARELT